MRKFMVCTKKDYFYIAIIVFLIASSKYFDYVHDKYIGTYIHIFGGVAKLPWTYSIDGENIKNAEIRLLGDKSQVLIGDSSKINEKTWGYIRKKSGDEKTECVFKSIEWFDDGVHSVFFYNKNSFIWFLDVADEDVEAAKSSICKTTKSDEKA